MEKKMVKEIGMLNMEQLLARLDSKLHQLHIERPSFDLEVLVKPTVLESVAYDEQYQQEAGLIKEAVESATKRFHKMAYSVTKRVVRERNRVMISQIALQNLHSRELGRLCDPELARAVETHRYRKVKKQLIWVQAQVAVAGDKKLKRQARAAGRKAA
jgi:hypothetical protein